MLKGFLAKWPESSFAAKATGLLHKREEQDDYTAAKLDGSVVALKGFLAKWPESSCAAEMTGLLRDREKQEEQGDYDAARRADSIAAYQGFLAKWPESLFAPVAAKMLRIREESDDWKAADAAGTAAAYITFKLKYPETKRISILQGNISLELEVNNSDDYQLHVSTIYISVTDMVTGEKFTGSITTDDAVKLGLSHKAKIGGVDSGLYEVTTAIPNGTLILNETRKIIATSNDTALTLAASASKGGWRAS